MAVASPDTRTPDTGTVAGHAPAGRRRRRTGLVAVVVGLALVGGGAAVLALPGDDGQSATRAADPVTVAAPVPADVTWETVSGRAVASSPSAGPRNSDGAVHDGFAHTPTGAALAALSIYTRCAFTPGGGWLEVTKAQVEPGKGRTAYIKARQAVEWKSPAGGWGQTAGYRVLEYTGQEATVQEAIRYSTGEIGVQQLTVVWRDGDWRLVLQSDGSASPFVAYVHNMNGFTPFAKPA